MRVRRRRTLIKLACVNFVQNQSKFTNLDNLGYGLIRKSIIAKRINQYAIIVSQLEAKASIICLVLLLN
jgi:hypothetical protein